MKNSILFLVTILILQSSAFVFGQNKNSLQKQLKLGQSHQIDQFSIEMMSVFKLIMDEPNLIKGYNEISLVIDPSNDNLGVAGLENTVASFLSKDISSSNREIASFNKVAYNELLTTQSNRQIELFDFINSSDNLELSVKNTLANNRSFSNYKGGKLQPIIRPRTSVIQFGIEDIKLDVNYLKPMPATSFSLGGWQFRVGAGERTYF